MKFRRGNVVQEPGFQITPMLDIVFLLLFFFVTTQIFSQWETELEVKLPTAETGRIPGRLPGEVIINIKADGAMVVNGQALDQAGLEALLARVVELFPGHPVLIRADRRTAYEHVIRVLDLCRRTDIWNVSFATAVEADSP